ncbi:CLUMA_CG019998, isoform A [Clunio marinus]|uniref:CLUMA_CG019998, isoform A n=1 Tax=Clunio marinus TaxID=568069 RepID=A0A1J1J4Y9_9DIPT|nr:CLUMA_CG019998, isoform A [Clunio marinus]
MVYQQINDNSFRKDMFRGENIMLSTSTSNSSFLNQNAAMGEYTDDRLQILDCEATRTYQEPMSQTRRICFIASIVGTILVVVVFLLLPCKSSCVTSAGLLKTRNWMHNYEKMEFKGDINTISQPLESKKHKNIVFMYRSDKIFPDLNKSKKSKQKINGGIVALSGNSGEIVWSREMSNEPRSIDCNLIDCDNNGTKDCLILDEFGQLSCLDSNGHFIYDFSNLKTSKQTRKDLLDFPLILPDLNGDKVNELMMGYSNAKNSTTDLVILSGANGKILLKNTQNCSYIHKLQIDTNFVIKFICMIKEDTEQQILKNLTDLYSLVSKKPLNLKKLQQVSKINQHKFYGKRSSTLEQTTISTVEDKKLEIENKGTWPRESKVSINLTSVDDGAIKIHFEYVASKVYAMVPVPFKLDNSRQGENVHGFIIKYWIWNGTEVKYNLERNRLKRSPESFTPSSSYKTKLLFLRENIMLIVFNSTNMKVENASQSNIVQFCQKQTKDKTGDKKNESICQPDLNYQENSVLIADIDNDGSKELISYCSTFVNENHYGDVIGDRWKLKTFVQLFKLETELPKLYSDVDIY